MQDNFFFFLKSGRDSWVLQSQRQEQECGVWTPLVLQSRSWGPLTLQSHFSMVFDLQIPYSHGLQVGFPWLNILVNIT